MESILTQLERVQKAIAVIEEGAQSYKIGNRSLTKADLSLLYAREADLKAACQAEAGTATTFAQTGAQ